MKEHLFRDIICVKNNGFTILRIRYVRIVESNDNTRSKIQFKVLLGRAVIEIWQKSSCRTDDCFTDPKKNHSFLLAVTLLVGRKMKHLALLKAEQVKRLFFLSRTIPRLHLWFESW